MSSTHPAATIENPWPCSHCGDGITLPHSIGKVPAGTKFAITLLFVLAAIACFRWQAVDGHQFLGVIASLVALGGWSLYRTKLHAWHCANCGFQEAPRLTASGKPRPLIVVPTYNNQSTIGDIIERIRKTCPDIPTLVLNDGSTDQTTALAQHAANASSAKATFGILSHSTYRGMGPALQTALRYGFDNGFSHIITLDGTGQHLPEDIPKLVEAIHKDRNAFWVGNPMPSQGQAEQAPPFRKTFSNFVLKLQTGTTLGDCQNGFRAYPTGTALSLGIRASGRNSQIEILTLGARSGIPLKNVATGLARTLPPGNPSQLETFRQAASIAFNNTRLLVGLFLWPLGWPTRFKRGLAPSGNKRKWAETSRIGRWGQVFVIYALKLAGPRLAAWACYPFAFYFMAAQPKDALASKNYLERILGKESRRWPRFWRSYQHIVNSLHYSLDRLTVLALGGESIHFSEDGLETICDATANQGAIILSAHLGNHDIAGSFLHQRNQKVAVVMTDSQAKSSLRASSHNQGNKSLPPVISIHRDDAPATKIVSALRDDYAVTLHGDRILDESCVECDFLGGKAQIPTSPFLIAATEKVPVILAFAFRIGFKRYHFISRGPHTITISDDNPQQTLRRYAQWYANQLEAVARAYPYHWFNFYDFWKKPEDALQA